MRKLANTWVWGALTMAPATASHAAEPPRPIEIANVETTTAPEHPEWSATEIVPNLRLAKLVAVIRPGGAPLDQLVAATPEAKDFVVAINGGYFDKHYAPTGWLVSAGTELHKVNKVASGGILALKGGEAYIGIRGALPFKTPDVIVQNGPLLLSGNGTVGIKKDNGRRAPRTVACYDKGLTDRRSRLKFIVIQPTKGLGPTLMETAMWIKRDKREGGFGCTSALNLDGGPSTGVIFGKALNRVDRPPLVPIGYGLAIVPV